MAIKAKQEEGGHHHETTTLPSDNDTPTATHKTYSEAGHNYGSTATGNNAQSTTQLDM